MGDINLRHLSHLVAVCTSNLSMSVAASRLNLDQSVVSRNIQALEQALGGPLFFRNGRRLTAMTPLCEAILERARDLELRVKDLEAVANAARSLPVKGEIRIACTHLQARYILPQVLQQIRTQHPRIKLIIHQCFPADINELLVANRADLGICSEKLAAEDLMHSVDAYAWERALIVPKNHPLAKAKKLTLAQLAKLEIVTYVHGITGRRQFDTTFANANLYPNVIIAAADSDVIKQFTRQGLAAGVIAAIAYDPKTDKDLLAKRLPAEFGQMHSRVIHRRDRRLTDPQRLFIECFCQESAKLSKNSVAQLR